MALLPYLLYDLRHRRRRDLNLSSDDFPTDIVDDPVLSMRKYLRPWENLSVVARDFGATIKTDKEQFQVNLDVQHFDPEDISVKISDRYVVIQGKHEERKDAHGYVSRQFKRRYALPEGCNPESVESRLSSDGVLTVVASKVSEGKDERAIPIIHTGPVRRKQHDEEDGNSKEASATPPQKKRKKLP